MSLKYNPYSFFRNRKTAVSLYARKKWLGESETKNWKKDFKDLVSQISGKDLWDEENLLSVIKRLFDLHLTVRDKTPEITDVVFKLLKNSEIILKNEDNKIIQDYEIANLPFSAAETCFVIPPSALFIASVFDICGNKSYEYIFEKLMILLQQTLAKNDMTVFIHNFFRVLAINPLYSATPESNAVLDRLLTLQNDIGDWGNKLPFYQTVNAVAHIRSENSDIIFGKALKFIINNQNKDGTWGNEDEKEWNTFLTVHALKNKLII